LARVLKSNVIPALDNIILEDERDLTNSANERIIFAENFILLDYIIQQMISILQGVEFNEINIEKNLNLTKGACLSEKIMLELVNRGIGRQEGHEILRKAVMHAINENKLLEEMLINNPKINEKFSEKELKDLLDPHLYTGLAEAQIDHLLEILKNKYPI